jgi:hypothetical protein
MPKSKKPKNDLRGVKRITAAAYAAAAVIFLVLPAAGAALFRYSFLRLSAVCLAGYLLTVFALWFFLEKRREGGEDEKLSPFMGRIMFEAVGKMASPGFLCGE